MTANKSSSVFSKNFEKRSYTGQFGKLLDRGHVHCTCTYKVFGKALEKLLGWI